MVRDLSAGRSDAELDERPDGSPFTIRELVHHIVEANVVAASIVVAGLGSPGSVYDWSWMLPFGKWMERMRYDAKPIGPTVALLEALNEYVVAQIEPLPDGLERTVQLRDEPGGELRTMTIADVLMQEWNHAREHVEAIRAA
jgi:hypothetical protein